MVKMIGWFNIVGRDLGWQMKCQIQTKERYIVILEFPQSPGFLKRTIPATLWHLMQNHILLVSERNSSGLACVLMNTDYIPLNRNVILHVAFRHSQQFTNVMPDTVWISEECSMKF